MSIAGFWSHSLSQVLSLHAVQESTQDWVDLPASCSPQGEAATSSGPAWAGLAGSATAAAAGAPLGPPSRGLAAAEHSLSQQPQGRLAEAASMQPVLPGGPSLLLPRLMLLMIAVQYLSSSGRLTQQPVPSVVGMLLLLLQLVQHGPSEPAAFAPIGTDSCAAQASPGTHTVTPAIPAADQCEASDPAESSPVQSPPSATDGSDSQQDEAEDPNELVRESCSPRRDFTAL